MRKPKMRWKWHQTHFLNHLFEKVKNFIFQEKRRVSVENDMVSIK
jgi:hypothetical protein